MIDFASLAGVIEVSVKSRAAHVATMSLYGLEPCEYLDILLFNDVKQQDIKRYPPFLMSV